LEQYQGNHVTVREVRGGSLTRSCPRASPRDEPLWVQDGALLWLVCGHQVLAVDLHEWGPASEEELVYEATIGLGVIDEIRAGGGMAAISIEGSRHLKFALVDLRGREHWTVTGEEGDRPHSFDIDDGGHVFAFAHVDGVTVQPLDGGPPWHLDAQVGNLAFIGRYLVTGTYGRFGGVHFEWFDKRSGEPIGTLDLDCRNGSSQWLSQRSSIVKPGRTVHGWNTTASVSPTR
jgi:hypothetical protein